VQGVPVPISYQRAGYKGGEVCRSQLRRSPDVEVRISWLLAQRVEADTRARHRADEKITDARLRAIRELERIAYADVRDVVQWDCEPVLDTDGNVTGFKDTMKVTPSHLLTHEQTAQIKSVTMKSGTLKFETYDKLAALAQLAKILGVAPEPQPQTVSSATLNVQQVNLGGPDSALESLRRLAFAIERIGQERDRATNAQIEGRKGSILVEGVAKAIETPSE
jgi:hypothetical protein